MPIFEYKCMKCKASKDMLVKYDERKVALDCPECSTAKTLEFVDKIQKSSFKLKGGGWFKDGY